MTPRNVAGIVDRMRTILLVASMLVASGCSGGGKPADMPNDTATPAPPVASATSATTSNGCGRTCAPEEICRSFYGIAGPGGPLFQECVIPCQRGTPNDGCPTGKKCITIADGPGDVCQ